MLSITIGLPLIIMAFMFQKITSKKEWSIQKISKNKAANILSLILKSIICTLALVAASFGAIAVIRNIDSILGIFGYFIANIMFTLPLIAVVYAYLLYQLIKKHEFRYLIIIINAAFLMGIWGLIIILSQTSYLEFGNYVFLTIVFGNTAIVTIMLAFVFKKVEKSGKPNADTNIEKHTNESTLVM